jgi:hypothetical protein
MGATLSTSASALELEVSLEDSSKYEIATLRFSQTSLVDFALLSTDRVGGTVQLLVASSTPPLLTVQFAEEEVQRITANPESNMGGSSRALLSEDLRHLAAHRVVCLTLDIGDWKRLVELAAHLTVPAFHTRISTVHRDPVPLSPSRLTEMGEEEKLCLWHLNVLFADRRLAVLSGARHAIAELVLQALEASSGSQGTSSGAEEASSGSEEGGGADVSSVKVKAMANALQQLPYLLSSSSPGTVQWADVAEKFSSLVNSSMHRNVGGDSLYFDSCGESTPMLSIRELYSIRVP